MVGERTYQFGRLRIKSILNAMLDNKPAFEINVSVEQGPSYTARVTSNAPIPASPTLYVIKDMRRLLKMGIARFVQFRMMNERRLPSDGPDLQADAAKAYMVALAAGDKTLAEAEKGLEAALPEEQAEYEKSSAAEVDDDVESGGGLRFDLGPIKLSVRLGGVIPGPQGDMGAYQVMAEVPGLPPHVATVASDDPLYSSQAAWYLDQLQAVLQAGPDTFYAQNIDKVQGDAEEGRQFAHSLYQVAFALGQPGIEHARSILGQAAAEEVADADQGLLERLEEELAQVREEISEIKHKRQPRGG